MAPKKQAKGGFFRPIKAKAKAGRGGDYNDTWAQFMDKCYAGVVEQFNEADEET